MMARPRVVMMYEDSFSPAKTFGLHDFLVRCLRDELNDGDSITTAARAKREFEARPKNGASNLIAALEIDLPKIARANMDVIAIFDNDRIREQLNLQSCAPTEDVLAAITRRLKDGKERLHIEFLEKNAESVLRAALKCGGGTEFEAMAPEAIERKRPVARDIMFTRIVRSDRAFRDCIRSAVPSTKAIVVRMLTLFDKKSPTAVT